MKSDTLEILVKATHSEILIKITNSFVDLANKNISDDDIPLIMAKIFEVNPFVTAYDFDNNKITDKGATFLTQFLSDCENIQSLSLQYNEIGREGTLSIMSLKRKFSELKILLHGNQINKVSEMEEIKRTALGQK